MERGAMERRDASVLVVWVIGVLLFLFMPIAHDRHLRVRPLERAELADPPLHHELVLGRVARPAGARRAVALGEGRARGDGASR